MRRDRLSVAHLTASFLPVVGGMECVVHALAQCQTEQGHDVTVICPPRAWWAMRRRVPYRMLPLPPRFGAMQLDAFRAGRAPAMVHAPYFSLLRRLMGFDVWHVHAAMPTAFAAAPGLAGARWLVTCHGADVQTFPSIGYGYRLIPGVDEAAAATLRAAPMVSALSPSMRRTIEGLGVEPGRIRDVPNGLWLDRFAAVGDRAATRSRLGVGPEETLVLTVGRNHPKKGFDHIPDCLARLAQRRAGWRFLLVGRGNEGIASRLAELGLRDRAIVLPPIGAPAEATSRMPTDELVALYKAADVFFFPTRIESFGMVTAEAMAAGLAVVTTDAEGSRDIVRDGIDGLLVPPDDVGAMAAALERLVADPQLRRRLGGEAAVAARAYDWPQVSARYLDCYQALCAATPRA